MKICRLCLYKGDEKQVLSIWENQIEDLATKIKNCVSVNITKDDTLPTSACLSCIHQVTQWEIFRNTCQKSNEILLRTVSETLQSDTKPLHDGCFLGGNINATRNGLEEPLEKQGLRATKRIPKRESTSSDEWDNEQKSNEILLRTVSETLQSYTKPLHDGCFLGGNISATRNGLEEPLEKQGLRATKRIPKRESTSSDEWDNEDADKDDDTDYFESGFLDYPFKTELCQNVYECEICLNEFDNCFEYLNHQDSHDGEPVFQCDKCPELFNSRRVLVEHDKNHRTSCPQCGKMVLKSSMKLHLIKHTDRYKCNQCNGRFNSKAALSQHIITVHTDIKDHICETCGKRFSSQTAMRVHMRSHSDERLYPCKLCSYAGRTASAIYVHMSTHANDLCVCEVCSKTFKSNRNLNDHLRRVHSKIKKHHCTYCDKKFVDKYMLRVHIRCHTGVRPYQCSLCEKAFIRSDGLKEHMSTHGQRTLYDCKDCGKKFTSKRGVTRHSCNSVL